MFLPYQKQGCLLVLCVWGLFEIQIKKHKGKKAITLSLEGAYVWYERAELGISFFAGDMASVFGYCAPVLEPSCHMVLG